ncbi:glycosyl transferase 2 family protein, partial [Escherichia coli]
MDVFSAIGFNKAEWFIDSIDIEWCYRARYLGYHVLMTTNVAMKHNLGARDVKLPGGKSINIGSPFRLYYVFRNWIFSLREPQFDIKYKMKILLMMPIKFIIFST